jgi:hypothetical protein
MPTHFHFLLKIRPEAEQACQKYGSNWTFDRWFSRKFGAFLNGYVHAFNNRYHTHGSLFQKGLHRKRIVTNEQLKTVLVYIHKNPVKDGLIDAPGYWLHSSYTEFTREAGYFRRNEMHLPALISEAQQTEVHNVFGGVDVFVKEHA